MTHQSDNQKHHARATPHPSWIDGEKPKQAQAAPVLAILVILVPVAVVVALPAIIHAIVK